MKRNWCSTIVEVFFPIVLMALLVIVRGLIKIDTNTYSYSDDDYTILKSSALINEKEPISNLNNLSQWNGLTYRNPL